MAISQRAANSERIPPVLATVRTLSRLERGAETRSATLPALARIAPDWLRTQVRPDWFARDGRCSEVERLPKGQQARRASAAQVGADGQQLLDAVDASAAPTAGRPLSAVATLRRMWGQPCTCSHDGGCEVGDPKALPKACDRYFVKGGGRGTGGAH
jgi:hypothetical protein